MTSPNLEEIHASRQLAGRVVRWHTWPMIRKPTSAEHVARVATIYCELWGIPRGEVLYYCLHHDSGELLAGDTPYWAKRYNPTLAKAVNAVESEGLRRLGVVLPKLSDQEFQQFKIADILEMWETAQVETTMGNRYAQVSLDGCYETAMALARVLDGTKPMIDGKTTGTIVWEWMKGSWRADTLREEDNG